MKFSWYSEMNLAAFTLCVCVGGGGGRGVFHTEVHLATWGVQHFSLTIDYMCTRRLCLRPGKYKRTGCAGDFDFP